MSDFTIDERRQDDEHEPDELVDYLTALAEALRGLELVDDSRELRQLRNDVAAVRRVFGAQA